MSFNHAVIEEFRANGGRVGGPFEGGDLLLLTTTGARSGEEHTVPLGYVRDGARLLIVASAGGSDRHPAWYHNLLAHPMVRVEIGDEMYGAIAVPAEGARRDALFAKAVDAAPGYADYQKQTARTIPVVTLQRSEPEADAPPPADLAGKLLEVHTWLRSQLQHVRAEADAYFTERERGGPGTPPGLGLQLRQHCLAFCESLTFHHTSEDSHLFPALEAAHPHLHDTFTRLHKEHQTLARLQKELLDLLEGVSTADPERFRTDLKRISEELRAHLSYEEEHLLPILAEIPLPPALT
ncbi:nitroreductase/quinone reductase family protein [Actinocorallia libanotica]